MEFIQSNFIDASLYNPLNLKFEFPKYPSRKFRVIELDLINACQLKCPMCLRQEYKGGKGVPGTSLKYNDIIKFFDLLSTPDYKSYFDIRLVRLIGTVSEPTLYKDLIRLIKFLNNRNISVQISTNGNLKDDSFWQELSKTLNGHYQNEILFAIEGATQDMYSWYRHGGNLQIVLDNLAIVSENRKFKLGWQFIKFKHNPYEYDRIKELIDDKIDFIEIFHCNEPDSLNQVIQPREEIQKQFYTKRKRINDMYMKEFGIGYFNTKDIGCVSKSYGEIYVSVDGRIWPCTNIYENNLNNFEDTPTITNPELKEELYKYLNKVITNRSKNEECFRSCSMLGHKFEKPFLRKRIIL